MYEFWSFFKFLETCGGLTCIGFHCYGFLRKAIDYDHVSYSIVFFAGTIFTMMSHLETAMGNFSSSIIEALLHLGLGIAFLGMMILTAYHTETEISPVFYQRLVTNRIVEVFKYAKAQTLASLTTGSFHLLHSVFAFDSFFTQDPLVGDEFDDAEVTPTGPLKMYFLNTSIHNYLLQYKWFQSVRGRVRSAHSSTAEVPFEI